MPDHQAENSSERRKSEKEASKEEMICSRGRIRDPSFDAPCGGPHSSRIPIWARAAPGDGENTSLCTVQSADRQSPSLEGGGRR
jgi:hypothetical protein